MYKFLKNKFRNIIKQALITVINDDSSAYPTMQVSHNGKSTKVTRLSPYGLDTNPVTGGWAFLFSSQGDESNKFGMSAAMLDRKKNLLEGEVALYNSLTENFILLKANGDTQVLVDNKLVLGNGTVELLNLMDRFIDEAVLFLQYQRDTVNFNNAGGPTSVPTNAALLTPIETNLTAIKTELSQILEV